MLKSDERKSSVLGKLGKRIAGFRRDPASQLTAVSRELSRAWSDDAFDALSALANDGYPPAQYRLGQMYERAEGVVQNLGDAVHWYGRAAEQGHALAQARLGLIFFIDPPAAAGLTNDGPLAPEGFVTAVGSDATALLGATLGESFPHGFAVGQDLKEAAKWNRLAAKAGIADAQARYGHQLAMGLGVKRDVVRAAKYLRVAAAQGYAAGQAALGVLLAGGYGGEPDFVAAAEWLKCASDQGNATAQFWLGLLYLRGDGITADSRAALELLKRASAQNHRGAMYQLGLCFWAGDPVARDIYAAETWLRRAATRGDIDAMRALAQLLLERPEDDGVDAAGWLRRGAESGDRRAAALLAELYLCGRGVPRDLVEAARWLGHAGTEARPQAFALLAAFHAQGVGGAENYASAADWLRRAARDGSIAAQYNLGSLHRLGKGVPQDPAEAADWYRKAALAGNAQAAFYLGLLYAEEKSPVHDYVEAAVWFRRAMEGGHGLALCNLALLSITGRGTEQDISAGLRLLQDGIASGCVDAAELLVDLHLSGDYLLPSPQHAAGYLVRALELGSATAAQLMVEARRRGYDLPYDRQRLRTVLELGARGGDSASALALGQLLVMPGDEAPDCQVAHPWFVTAAEAGNAEAQAWLGDCARLGLLGNQDLVAAESWYRKAAGQGQVSALVQLALMGESSGPRSRESDIERFGLWIAAASAGSVLAQRTIGLWYLQGRGCTADEGAAVRWFRLAADQGDAEAQFLLGRCHRAAVGGLGDEALAKLWLERAADQGHTAAGLALSESGRDR